MDEVNAMLMGLRVAGRRVLVVGGGRVALRRVALLLDADADVLLVASTAVPTLTDLAERGRLTWRARRYRDGDLAGAWLAFACTDDPDVNATVVQHASGQRTWCSRADDATAGTAWTPSTGRVGPAVVGVLSGRDPRRSVALRDAAVGAIRQTLARGQAATGRPSSTGRVVLVGGGPGDPRLITQRGRDRLAVADVVLVDRLAPLGLLDELGEHVQIIDVAKIPRGTFTPQQTINALLVEHARAGRTVVRLKGGDSFVFGRGAEEMQACQQAGIDVEVVPGVTSAVAAPALAGIPVTHRGVVQGFAVVSGHLPPDHPDSTVDWTALASSGLTIVCLMAVQTLPLIAAHLLAHGMTAGTQVAVVQDASLPGQRVIRYRLADLVEQQRQAPVSAPAVVVIGEVAALAPDLAAGPG